MKNKILITTFFLTLIGSGVYFGAGYAIKPLATQFIRQNGFPEAHISSVSLIPSGLLIDSISLDGDDFSTIENIVISFNLLDFLKNRHINSLEIKDISLTAELDETNHLKIAGWDATIPKSDTTSSLFPIRSVLLQGITIDLDTPHGDIRLQGKLSLETPTQNHQTIEYALWGQQHQLSFDAKGSGKLSSNGDMSFSTILNEGRMNLPNIELSRASAEINVLKTSNNPTPAITGKLLAGKINTLGALLQNVTISLDTTKSESLSFTTSPAGYKDIQIDGRWITSPENYLELTVSSLRTLDIIELLYPDKVKEYKPWVEDANPLRLNIKSPLSSLQNDKKTAYFQLFLGKENSDMSLQANGFAAYETVNSKTILQLDKTILQMAGGKINVSPLVIDTIDAGKIPINITLSIQSIDMAKMAKLAEIKGLAVQGCLSGTLPLTYSDKGIIFSKGALSSDSSGFFAYKPNEFPPSFQGNDERMKLVRDALSDFRFSKLSFDMTGELDHKMKTTLTAEGTNPALGERPIKLNLNLDGDIGAILKQALQAGGIPDRIRSR